MLNGRGGSIPRPIYIQESDPVPIGQEAGLVTGQVWTNSAKIAIPGIDSWIMQPVVSRYMDCAIPAHRYEQSPVEKIHKYCCFSQLLRYF